MCIETVILLFLFRLGICNTVFALSTDVLWVNCDTWICRQPRLNIECDKFSRVLITNVTSGVNAGFDLLSFDNLRRSCLGLSSCRTSDPQVFCKNHDKSPSLGQSVQFNVSYVCVPESMINKTYENEFQTFRAPSGFIISLNYPTETRYSTFRWKIHVPEGYYVHIFLYDVLTKSDNPITCKGGLHFSSKSTCNLRFPTFPICHTRDWDGVISACSDVDIFLLLDTNNDGIRFWLSYHVVRVEDLSLVSMFKRDHICNLQLLDQFEYRPPEVRNATDATTDAPYDDVIVTSPAGAKDEQADYVTYIGLAVAVLVLLVVIVVAVIYARYRMSAAVSAKDSVMSGLPTSTSQNNCSDIQKRPLPERQSTSEADAVVGLTVQSSYSVVADEVSPECSAGGGNPVYSTYAEIEEFSGDNKDKSKPPLANKRSVDNSKRKLPAKPNVYKSIHVEVEDSDVKDAKTEKSSVASKNARNQVMAGPSVDYMFKKKLSNASNIYAECEDVPKKAEKPEGEVRTKAEKPTGEVRKKAEKFEGEVQKKAEKIEKTYIDMSHKRFVEPDYVPHSHSKDAHSKAVPHTKYSKDKVNQSKKSNVGEKPVSEKIPYADNDVKKTHPFLCSQGQQRTLVTSESDSDDDICVENELYEPFESAKV